jgi:hypothetical protein
MSFELLKMSSSILKTPVRFMFNFLVVFLKFLVKKQKNSVIFKRIFRRGRFDYRNYR